MGLCALIMIDRTGSRFCSQSTTNKQFLRLIFDKTMLQMTYDRINEFVSKIYYKISNDGGEKNV